MSKVTPLKILHRLDVVKKQTGLSASRIYALVKENKFPKPVRLGSMSVAWIESEVQDWINMRIIESRKSAGITE